VCCPVSANVSGSVSEGFLYIDGVLEAQTLLPLPTFKSPVTHAAIATSVASTIPPIRRVEDASVASVVEGCRSPSLVCQMTCAYVFCKVLTNDEVLGIYALGPNYSASFRPNDGVDLPTAPGFMNLRSKVHVCVCVCLACEHGTPQSQSGGVNSSFVLTFCNDLLQADKVLDGSLTLLSNFTGWRQG
jgi:hypothetical protein